jgi:Zn finger protein HypA/HybF involved in hydrogenase expression
VSSDRDKEVRFECLRCGKISPIERVKFMQPRCGRCGSGTGVLGDIGQGTPTSRGARGYGAGGKGKTDTWFECLRCGEITTIGGIIAPRPNCLHCGSKAGVVVEGRS